jgi:outer membrane receptor protein involved in Fe transport
VQVLTLLAAAALMGRILDPNGAPVADANVTARKASLVNAVAVRSDAKGEFRIEELPAGGWILAIEKAGFAPYHQAVQTGTGRPLELLVKLTLSPVRAEVTVSAEAGAVVATERSAQRVGVVSKSVLEERVTHTLTEAAAGEVGVSEQRTAPAMGSFFVRGMTGKNVSVYRDGVRYTTSAQRGGVSTFQNLVDAGALEAIEFLRGPDSAQFGSDSLGGSVQLISKAPALSGGGRQMHGETGALYDSATSTMGAQAQGVWSQERFGVATTLSARRVNTARTGGGLDSHAAVTRFLGLPSDVLGARLPDTAFTQYGGSTHAQWQLTPLRHLIAHYERGQQDGVKRYDQLSGGDGNLIADLRNLMLDFGYVRYQQFQAGPMDQVSASVSYNTQREERVNQGGQGNPGSAITHQYERMKAWGVQAQAERRAGGHAVLFGAEGYREKMVAPAYTWNPVSNQVTLTRPRVPDGARYLNYGVFVQDVWEPERARRLRLSGALRFGGASYRSLAANGPLVGGVPLQPPLWPDDSLSANALTGRAGATYLVGSSLWLHGQFSRGFRVPNMTDLGTLGLQGNGRYESSYSGVAGRGAELGDRADDRAVSTGQPVDRLRPETSNNLDLGGTWKTERMRAEATAFWMRLGNTVVSQSLILPQGAVGQPLGDQIISRQLASGVVFVPAASNAVLVRANYGGAVMLGLEQSLRVRLTKAWTIQQNYTWIEARDQETGLPPDLEPGAPPPGGMASLLYSPEARRYWVEGYMSAADRQSRLSSLALADRRIGASRSRTNIADYFNNGARVRGLVAGGVLAATGETLPQVQNRVLGAAPSAPMFMAIPGYAVFGVRGGFPVGSKSDVMVDLTNIGDRNYRGIGWGIDGLGRGVTVKWRFRL